MNYVAPNSLSFGFCLSLSNLTNYKSVAFRSLTILNSATFSSMLIRNLATIFGVIFFYLRNYESSYF